MINRILTDKDRDELKPLIAKMWELCPEMMGRKIPEANVQQAFVLEQVLRLVENGKHSILSVGSFEDTAYEYLRRKGYSIEGIDPELNTNLHNYTRMNPDKRFDIVFATSVIEHVENDYEFLEDMCKLLKEGGFGILTTDFKDDYKLGDPLPYSDIRFYTRQVLEVGFSFVLNRCGCEYVDKPDWTGKDSFVYQGHQYSFATLVFRKK